MLDLIFFAFPWYMPIERPVEVRFASVFSDHAVLQRESTVPVWGSAIPQSKVTVRASWLRQAMTAVADERGRWQVKVATGKAGGPHSLTVELGKTKQTITDVQFGEVWLMGGQSNMEWQVGWSAGCHPTLSHDEVRSQATQSKIRYFFVPKSMAPEPTLDIDSKWQPISPQTVDGCSAVGYYFACKLQKELGPDVPIGLLNCAYGGSEIEQWIDEPRMRQIESFAKPIAAYEKAMEATALTLLDWDVKLKVIPESAPKELGQAFGQYFSQRVTGDWGFDGLIWYRAEFDVPEATEGTLSLGFADYGDVVWVNGERVGSNVGENQMRAYSFKSKAGKNEVLIAVLDIGGVGGLGDAVRPMFIGGKRGYLLTNWHIKFGRPLSELKLTVPPARRWSRMYNSMLTPLAGYGIKGMGWYQGESNVGRGHQYEMALREMIASWRKQFGPKPFGIIQIAPFTDYGGSGVSSDVRESMARVAQEKRNGLVVTTDLVDNLKDIHPKNKLDVGNRLAMWALNEAYGRKSFPRGGASLVRSTTAAGSIVLEMDMPVTVRSGPNLFTIAGADGKFFPADIAVSGARITVSSAKVPAPKAVRYNWTDDGQGNLFGENGLPASNFRTDKWEVLTQKNGW